MRISLGGTFLSGPSSARPGHNRCLVTCLAMLSASIHTLSRKARVIVRICGSRGLQKRHQTPPASPWPGHGFLLARCARSPEISLVFERFATYSASYSSSIVLEASNRLTKLSVPAVACSVPHRAHGLSFNDVVVSQKCAKARSYSSNAQEERQAVRQHPPSIYSPRELILHALALSPCSS